MLHLVNKLHYQHATVERTRPLKIPTVYDMSTAGKSRP